jgi:tetratricopeptide (TPR) repeat protein
MRRLLILIGLSLLISIGGYSQSSKRTSAYMYMQNGQLDKAKESIDEAVQHEKTMTDAKTWLYRGEIYYEIARSPLEIYKNLDANAPMVAYESLLKAKEFDVKGKYEKDISLYMGNLTQVFYNTGNTAYQAGDYLKAIQEFQVAYDIADQNGALDTIAAYYIGMCGVLAEKPEIASEYLSKCVEAQFDDPNIYRFYNRAVKQMGDTARAIEIINEGRERYPEELDLLLELAQIYLEQGKKEELLTSLLEAVEADPTNSNLYFLIGKTYDDKGETVQAEEYYKKAAEVKPDFFEAYYNIGAIYVNKAAELQAQANDLPLDQTEKYNELSDQALANLELAVPYLEKSLEIRPDDQPTIYALKEAYARLKMDDKLKDLNNR